MRIREMVRVGLPLLAVAAAISSPAPESAGAYTRAAERRATEQREAGQRGVEQRGVDQGGVESSGDTVSFRTSDGLTIRGTVRLPAGESAHRAAIFIHQGGSDRSEWAEVAERLTARGYVTLAYDVRGHGKSDGRFDVALFNDPHRAPLDLIAALAFLRGRDDVDPERIAVVGASIGANLAAMATSELGVRTAVAISGKTSAVYALAGRDSLALRSVFYLASSGDQGGKRARWAKELYARTAEPRRVRIAEESSGHGVAVLRDQPELVDLIFEWLDATL